MGKNRTNILIVVLIIFQIVLIAKISSLQGQIENINAQTGNLNNDMRNVMKTFYSDVDEILRREASLIESADTEIGTVNADELTIPITFSITPKEVSEHTAVSLDFDGELFPMERDGITFTTTISRNIFGDALPKIVIDEEGIKKIMQDEQVGIWNIKERIFSIMAPRFSGKAGFSKGTYTRKGTLSIDTKNTSSGIEFEKIRLVGKVDGKVISDEIIPNEMFSGGAHGYEIDQKIPLNNGQVYTMTIIATDSIGLEHHYNVEHWTAGSNQQREPLFDNEKIYSADGKLLWEPKWE